MHTNYGEDRVIKIRFLTESDYLKTQFIFIVMCIL